MLRYYRDSRMKMCNIFFFFLEKIPSQTFDISQTWSYYIHEIHNETSHVYWNHVSFVDTRNDAFWRVMREKDATMPK